MKLALRTWQPVSNWTTALLLTLVVTGFGLFAQHRVDAGAHGLVQADLVVARTK